jgi:transcriptional regulator with XRE-family HTH domain
VEQPAAKPHEVLARLIDASGLSKAKIAELVGVRRQSVTNWTSNLANPSLDNLRRLEEVLRGGGVVLAAYGYEVTGIPEMTVESAIRADERFDDEERELLLRLVDNFARRNAS